MTGSHVYWHKQGEDQNLLVKSFLCLIIQAKVCTRVSYIIAIGKGT